MNVMVKKTSVPCAIDLKVGFGWAMIKKNVFFMPVNKETGSRGCLSKQVCGRVLDKKKKRINPLNSVDYICSKRDLIGNT